MGCCCEYETLRKWTRLIQMSACGSIVIIGILRFIFIGSITSPVYYIINVYLVLLGILSIVAEFDYEPILKYFNFLRYFLGKAFLCVL